MLDKITMKCTRKDGVEEWRVVLHKDGVAYPFVLATLPLALSFINGFITREIVR